MHPELIRSMFETTDRDERIMRNALWWAVLSLTITSAAEAQHQSTERAAPAWHQADCRLAAQVLTLGQPANKRDWAVRFARSCGSVGGEAIGRALREHRTDVHTNEELELLVTSTSALIDAAIFEAALDVAGDPDAGVVARVQAVRAIYFQLHPGRLDPYESFLPGHEEAYFPLSHHEEHGTPLPPDAHERAAVLAELLRSDADERIRSAAEKLGAAVRVGRTCMGAASLQECWARLQDRDGRQ